MCHSHSRVDSDNTDNIPKCELTCINEILNPRYSKLWSCDGYGVWRYVLLYAFCERGIGTLDSDMALEYVVLDLLSPLAARTIYSILGMLLFTNVHITSLLHPNWRYQSVSYDAPVPKTQKCEPSSQCRTYPNLVLEYFSRVS